MTDYKLVPVEPTPEMLEAGEYAQYTGCYVSGIYADMLAAAPAVQGEPVGEVRFEFGAPSSIFAELYSKSLPALAPGTKLYTAPQPAPDVAGLVDALEQCITSMLDSGYRANAVVIRAARSALAAHRKGESM